MEQPAIMIRFPNEEKAHGAFETLLELGYKPEMLEPGLMDVTIDQQDITTALEIVEVFEGKIQDHDDSDRDMITPRFGGNQDTEFSYLSIPAHTVNEDLDEEYLSGLSDNPYGDTYLEEERNYSRDTEIGAAYGGFSGSVKA